MSKRLNKLLYKSADFKRLSGKVKLMNYNIATAVHADWECGEWVDNYFDNFDANALARETSRANVDALELWAKDHFGLLYYPSKIGPQHHCLKGRDVFGEMCEASLRHDLIPRAAVMILMESHYVRSRPDAIAKDRF